MTHSNKLKLSKEYIAGFFDGEGYLSYEHFTDEKNKKWRRYLIVIVNTNKKILGLIQKEYHGVLSLKKDNQLRGYLECWELRMCKRDGMKFLQEIAPYLIIKKDKARNFLRFAIRKGYFN